MFAMHSATFHVMEDNFTCHGGQLLQRWNIYTNFAAQSLRPPYFLSITRHTYAIYPKTKGTRRET